jgi:TRAP-type C4-dicarboxylate transport system permease small subunit
MLERLERLFVRLNQILVGVMMGIMFVLVFINVVTRYAFGFSFATTEEISTFLMIWITYLGAGLALREGRHAAIDIFQDLLPEKARRAVRISLGMLILVFFAALAYYGIKIAQFGWAQETWATQIPRGIPYLCVPIGAAAFVLHLILMFREWVDRDWDESAVRDEMDVVEGAT